MCCNPPINHLWTSISSGNHFELTESTHGLKTQSSPYYTALFKNFQLILAVRANHSGLIPGRLQSSGEHRG